MDEEIRDVLVMHRGVGVQEGMLVRRNGTYFDFAEPHSAGWPVLGRAVAVSDDICIVAVKGRVKIVDNLIRALPLSTLRKS